RWAAACNREWEESPVAWCGRMAARTERRRRSRSRSGLASLTLLAALRLGRRHNLEDTALFRNEIFSRHRLDLLRGHPHVRLHLRVDQPGIVVEHFILAEQARAAECALQLHDASGPDICADTLQFVLRDSVFLDFRDLILHLAYYLGAVEVRLVQHEHGVHFGRLVIIGSGEGPARIGFELQNGLFALYQVERETRTVA